MRTTPCQLAFAPRLKPQALLAHIHTPKGVCSHRELRAGCAPEFVSGPPYIRARPLHPSRDILICSLNHLSDTERAAEPRDFATPPPSKANPHLRPQLTHLSALTLKPLICVKTLKLWRNSQLADSKVNIKSWKISQNLPRKCHNRNRYSHHKGTLTGVPLLFYNSIATRCSRQWPMASGCFWGLQGSPGIPMP